MQALAPYKSRKHSVISLVDGKEYKIPNEYTVEEVERLLELRAKQEAIEKEEVKDRDRQLPKFWQVVFEQITILFQHHQPDVTTEYLKSVVTQNEALEMLGFFQKYRHAALKKEIESKSPNQTDSKKKARLAKYELRDLRRTVAFMVTCGFSLLELRKLYIDELHQYYAQLVYLLEMNGTLKKGSYDKIKNNNRGEEVGDTVNLLREQMFNSIASKGNKK